MSDELYAPNQQLVRADGSGPAEEGEGGTPGLAPWDLTPQQLQTPPPPPPEPEGDPKTARKAT